MCGKFKRFFRFFENFIIFYKFCGLPLGGGFGGSVLFIDDNGYGAIMTAPVLKLPVICLNLILVHAYFANFQFQWHLLYLDSMVGLLTDLSFQMPRHNSFEQFCDFLPIKNHLDIFCKHVAHKLNLCTFLSPVFFNQQFQAVFHLTTHLVAIPQEQTTRHLLFFLSIVP
jgi:hypothetical protein